MYDEWHDTPALTTQALHAEYTCTHYRTPWWTSHVEAEGTFLSNIYLYSHVGDVTILTPTTLPAGWAGL